jgi:putative DNA-invertase from lambdoid prophage Rac
LTRAALYLRVSTDGQTVENQRAELAQLATARGWAPVWYEETASGAKARPVLDQLVRDAKAGKAEVLAFWALDRLSREGAGPVLNLVHELARVGVKLVSIRESWLDTSGPFGDVLVAFAATMARLERERLIERTRAGIDRARREGKAIGRPRASPILLHAAADLVAAGEPLRAAARSKGVAEATLRRFLAARRAPAG